MTDDIDVFRLTQQYVFSFLHFFVMYPNFFKFVLIFRSSELEEDVAVIEGMAEEDIAVTRFRQYLRIKSVQPNPDYASCVRFLKDYSKELGLEFEVVEPHPDKPFVILTWYGENRSLRSIVLHSHMDVVPVFLEHWTYDPFGAHKDEKGNIYARGAQDMKCVAIQYLEAIRQLKNSGVKLLRTVHLTFSSDEEIGAKLGMEKFVQHEAFRKLNHGFSLDEGLAFPDDIYRVYYAERSMWWLKVIFNGQPGHGSKFIEDTAAEKLRNVVNSLLDFRESERKKLEENQELTLGDVISVNMTKMDGGVQINVVPAELSAHFDIRVPPTINKDEFLELIDKWIKEAGSGITYEWPVWNWIPNMTPTDNNDPWWKAFAGVLHEMGLKYKKEVFSAGTDARFMRQLGFPALGFTPITGTPQLLHDHNEFLNEMIFLDGVKIYAKIIPVLANVSSVP